MKQKLNEKMASQNVVDGISRLEESGDGDSEDLKGTTGHNMFAYVVYTCRGIIFVGIFLASIFNHI